MDISKLSLDELKALAFDQIRIRDQAQANINALLAEIDRREKLIAEMPVKDNQYFEVNQD